MSPRGTGTAAGTSGERRGPAGDEVVPPGLPDGAGDGAPRSRRLGLLATAAVGAAFAIAILPAVPSRLAAVAADSEGASGRVWLDAALAAMGSDPVVVSWWSYSTPLWYAQLVEGRRPDIRVVDDRTRLDQGLGDIFSVIDANLGSHTVYAIRIDGSEIARIVRRYGVTVIPLPDGPPLVRIDRIKDRSA